MIVNTFCDCVQTKARQEAFFQGPGLLMSLDKTSSDVAADYRVMEEDGPND